jgi:trk system potassium uptake protein TrkH
VRTSTFSPTQQVLLTFLGLIALGTVLLSLPMASTSGSSIGLVDALFTATSATCVTGLIVRSTPGEFTTFGLAVILGLIQVGGLGIMTFSMVFAQILGKKADLNQQRVLAEEGTSALGGHLGRTLQRLAFWVLLVEALGAGALLLYYRRHDLHGAEAFSRAVFHSVSAFCNAGFALDDASLMNDADSLGFNLVIMALIVTGGLGFTVLGEVSSAVRRWLESKWTRKPIHPPIRFSYHARLVTFSTAVLIVGGAALFMISERSTVLAGASPRGAVLRATFLSVTSRTAGFNTVDMAQLSHAGLWFMILLMAIGASPGGTGGGIKTTTVAVLFAAMRQQIRGERHAYFWDRRIPQGVLEKAIALSFCFLVFFGMSALVLMMTESQPFEAILFETMSALGTVGLSLGITGELSTPGKLIVTLLMLAGRLGPLTLMLGLRISRQQGEVLYAEDKSLVIG